MVKYTPVSVLNPQMKGSALTFNCWPLFLWKSTWVGGRGWVITSEVRITIWLAGFFGIQLYQYDKDSNFLNSYDLQQNLLYHTLQMLWIYTEFWWAGLKVNNLCVFSKKKFPLLKRVHKLKTSLAKLTNFSMQPTDPCFRELICRGTAGRYLHINLNRKDFSKLIDANNFMKQFGTLENSGTEPFFNIWMAIVTLTVSIVIVAF